MTQFDYQKWKEYIEFAIQEKKQRLIIQMSEEKDYEMIEALGEELHSLINDLNELKTLENQFSPSTLELDASNTEYVYFIGYSYIDEYSNKVEGSTIEKLKLKINSIYSKGEIETRLANRILREGVTIKNKFTISCICLI